VLVLRALGLGDLLTGVPALRGLRRAFPHARLVLAGPAELGGWLASGGVVDDVVGHAGLRPLAWDGKPPELAVNLHGRGPQSHRLLAALAPARTLAYACPEAGFALGPAWPPDVHEVDRWCDLVRSAGGPCGPQDLRLPPPQGVGPMQGRYAVLHPGASSPARRWPAERWAAVASALFRRGMGVVLTGSRAESPLCAAIAAAVSPGRDTTLVRDTSGTLDLSGLARSVARASLVVCGDTGPAHLATAYGVPSVTLFGPSDPARWGPRLDQDIHRVLWHAMPGQPPGDPHGDTIDPRLAAITVDEVVAEVDAIDRRALAFRPS
jgi:ADP-heptose:LPS heptosyltransferase